MAWDYFPLSTVPASYDIVWCRFPFQETPGQPGEKSRPGLVRGSLADQDGNPWVRVVYGTSQNVFLRDHRYLTIANAAEMDACGLYRATRFDLLTCEELPWCSEFFETMFGYDTPIVGHLSQHMTKLLQIQASYLQRDGRL